MPLAKFEKDYIQQRLGFRNDRFPATNGIGNAFEFEVEVEVDLNGEKPSGEQLSYSKLNQIHHFLCLFEAYLAPFSSDFLKRLNMTDHDLPEAKRSKQVCLRVNETQVVAQKN